jgi:hypothetical protein
VHPNPVERDKARHHRDGRFRQCLRARIGGDAGVIGDTLRVQGITLEIIGVAPPKFRGLGITIEPDVTVPLSLVPAISEAEPVMVRGAARCVATT